MRPTTLKQSLHSEVEAFLASGGRITTVTRRPEAIPYLGTDKQAAAVLRNASQLAVSLVMSIEGIEKWAMMPDFPQCYIHQGERKWYYKEVRNFKNKRL